MRTLSETVRLDARTKLLNPKWYEGMLSSGYEGVREIQKRLTNTMGWSATSGTVDNWIYDDANSTFIEDEDMQKRLMDANPNSFRKLVASFLEANGCAPPPPAARCWWPIPPHFTRLSPHPQEGRRETAANVLCSLFSLSEGGGILPPLLGRNGRDVVCALAGGGGVQARVLGHVGGEPGAPPPAVHRRGGQDRGAPPLPTPTILPSVLS